MLTKDYVARLNYANPNYTSSMRAGEAFGKLYATVKPNKIKEFVIMQTIDMKPARKYNTAIFKLGFVLAYDEDFINELTIDDLIVIGLSAYDLPDKKEYSQWQQASNR